MRGAATKSGLLAFALALAAEASAQIPESSTASDAEVEAARPVAAEGDDGGRIIGGTSVRPGDLPFQVQIMQNDNGSGWQNEHRCGGALITPEWVVTAAHCFFNARSDEPFSAKVFGIRVGIVDLKSAPSSSLKAIRASGLYIHPGYVSKPQTANNRGKPWSRMAGFPLSPQHSLWFTHDIALIRLAEPVEVTDRVKPIARYGTPPKLGLDVSASGWGLTADRGSSATFNFSGILQVVELETVPCTGETLPTHICAGGRKGKDTCQGDSGGPLFLYDPKRPGVPILVGVTSRRTFGGSCGGDKPETRYSRVDGDNGAWIDRVLAADGKRW